MIDPQQEAQRATVRHMAETVGMDLTTFAREAGLSPSTLTRFMNQAVKNLLSARTMAKLEKVAGTQPSEQDAEKLPKSARLRAVAAVAEALDVSPAEVAALDERVTEWIAIISRIPPEIEGNARKMMLGLVTGGGATQDNGSPSERLRRRRKG